MRECSSGDRDFQELEVETSSKNMKITYYI